MSLPRNPDDLRGLRAAIWIRESTPGQFDRYGPETQRRLIRAAIARLGLIDTGIEFSVARSGSTVYLHKTMREAIAAAQAGAYDVLVVAYVDRWQRNLRQTLNVLDDELHPAGVGVWFCDEEIRSQLRAQLGSTRRSSQGGRVLAAAPPTAGQGGPRGQAFLQARPGWPPAIRLPARRGQAHRRRSRADRHRQVCLQPRAGGPHRPGDRCPARPAALYRARHSDLTAVRRPTARRRPRELAAGHRRHDLERRRPAPCRPLPPDPWSPGDPPDLSAADARMRRLWAAARR